MCDGNSAEQRFSWFISMTADELYEAATARLSQLVQLRNEQSFYTEEYGKVLAAKGLPVPVKPLSFWDIDDQEDVDVRLYHRALDNKERIQREIDDYSKTRNFLSRMDDGRQLMLKLDDYAYFFDPIDYEVY